MRVEVRVYANRQDFERQEKPLVTYLMDDDDEVHRQVLGRQCRSAHAAGQVIVTIPKGYFGGE